MVIGSLLRMNLLCMAEQNIAVAANPVSVLRILDYESSHTNVRTFLRIVSYRSHIHTAFPSYLSVQIQFPILELQQC